MCWTKILWMAGDEWSMALEGLQSDFYPIFVAACLQWINVSVHYAFHLWYPQLEDNASVFAFVMSTSIDVYKH